MFKAFSHITAVVAVSEAAASDDNTRYLTVKSLPMYTYNVDTVSTDGFLKVGRGVTSTKWVFEVGPMSEELPNWTKPNPNVTIGGAFYKVKQTWIPCDDPGAKTDQDCIDGSKNWKLIEPLIYGNEVVLVQLSPNQRAALQNPKPTDKPVEPIGYCWAVGDGSSCGTWTSMPSTTNPTIKPENPEVVLV